MHRVCIHRHSAQRQFKRLSPSERALQSKYVAAKLGLWESTDKIRILKNLEVGEGEELLCYSVAMTAILSLNWLSS